MEEIMRKFYDPVEEILLSVDDCDIEYNFNIRTTVPCLIFKRNNKETIKLFPPIPYAGMSWMSGQVLFYGDANMDNSTYITKNDFNLIISKIEDKFGISIGDLTFNYINYI